MQVLDQVMHSCWVRDPDERPSFEELKAQLEELWMELRQDDMKRANQVSPTVQCHVSASCSKQQSGGNEGLLASSTVKETPQCSQPRAFTRDSQNHRLFAHRHQQHINCDCSVEAELRSDCCRASCRSCDPSPSKTAALGSCFLPHNILGGVACSGA